jgi:hypothetical protein
MAASSSCVGIRPSAGRKPLDGAGQVRHVLGAVAERIMGRVRSEGKDRGVLGRVLEGDAAGESECLRAGVEGRHRHAIPEDIEHPAERGRLGIYIEGRLDQPLVVAVAGPKHDPVFAERDRTPIPVDRSVADGEDRQVCRLRARADAVIRDARVGPTGAQLVRQRTGGAGSAAARSASTSTSSGRQGLAMKTASAGSSGRSRPCPDVTTSRALGHRVATARAS